MLYMLMGATQERGGTSLRLGFRYDLLTGNQVGAKTGTTANFSDGWFMGVTEDLVSGCWVGAEDRAVHFKGIRMGQGAEMALPIWGYYMQKVYADTTLGIKKKVFKRPDGDLSDLIECGYIRPLISADQNSDEQKSEEKSRTDNKKSETPLYGDKDEDEGLY
jgi:penicillin-binding protein 1A